MRFARVKMGYPPESFLSRDIPMLFHLQAKQSPNQHTREKRPSHRPMLCNLYHLTSWTFVDHAPYRQLLPTNPPTPIQILTPQMPLLPNATCSPLTIIFVDMRPLTCSRPHDFQWTPRHLHATVIVAISTIPAEPSLKPTLSLLSIRSRRSPISNGCCS